MSGRRKKFREEGEREGKERERKREGGRKEREEGEGGRRGGKREEKGENGQMRKEIEGLCATVNISALVSLLLFGNAMHTTLSKSTLKCGHFAIL